MNNQYHTLLEVVLCGNLIRCGVYVFARNRLKPRSGRHLGNVRLIGISDLRTLPSSCIRISSEVCSVCSDSDQNLCIIESNTASNVSEVELDQKALYVSSPFCLTYPGFDPDDGTSSLVSVICHPVEVRAGCCLEADVSDSRGFFELWSSSFSKSMRALFISNSSRATLSVDLMEFLILDGLWARQHRVFLD
ncbi:hypothetical protein Tco_0133017 [Tanacetum coccineum]